MLYHSAAKLVAAGSLLLLGGCTATKPEECQKGTMVIDYLYKYPVFFKFGGAVIWEASQKRFDDDVNAILKVTPERLVLHGYTDTVGSDAINLVISKARTAVIAQRLIAAGYPADRIEQRWYGKAFGKQLVPTGNNVREPQNRRVEIELINPHYPPSVVQFCTEPKPT